VIEEEAHHLDARVLTLDGVHQRCVASGIAGAEVGGIAQETADSIEVISAGSVVEFVHISG
jgi:hypothetical protein